MTPPAKSQISHWKVRLRRLFPWTQWLLNYKITDLRYDIIAGFTVGLTLVPQCMAYAQIANVKPEYGLYSSFLAQFMYAIMGTSKDASIGPSSIVSMILCGMNAANPLIKDGDNTYNCIMAFMSGVILILIGMLRLGFVVNLFSIPVVSGFTSAAGFTIMASQLKSFFGLSQSPNESPCVVLKQVANLFTHLDEIKIVDVTFGSTCIAFLLFAQYFPTIIQSVLERRNYRRNETTPEIGAGSLLTPGQATFMEYLRLIAASRNVVVFLFTTLAAYLLCQSDPNFESSISLVGYIKPGFPEPTFPKLEIVAPVAPMSSGSASVTLPVGLKFLHNLTTTVPAINLLAENASLTAGSTQQQPVVVLKTTAQVFADLAVSLFIVPMMMMLELFAITKSLGRKNGYRVDATNELLAVGIGNILQSFFQAMPSTAAVTRCALNDQCKVKTQLGSIISATIVIIAISALTQTFYYIPKAALAAIIITAAHNLIDFRIVRTMYREYWRDVVILFVTFCLCLFFDMAYGILICLLVSMLTFLRPVVRMQLNITREIHPIPGDDSKHPSRMTVVKLSHGMKYPSADKFLDRMARILARGDKHIVLDCQFWSGIDYTGLQALRMILLTAYQQNKHIIFTNLSEHLLKEVEAIGLDHWKYSDSVDEAVDQYNRGDVLSAPSIVGRSLSVSDVGREEASKTSTSHNKEHEHGVERKPSSAAASIRRVVSITRPMHHYHRQQTALANSSPSDGRHSHHQSGELSSQPPPIYSRQTSSRRASTSRDAESAVNQAEAGIAAQNEAADRRTQESILRNLTVQAYFYQDIPITVGNLIEGTADDDDDDSDFGDLDLLGGDDGVKMEPITLRIDQNKERPLRTCQRSVSGASTSQRCAKISECRESEEADAMKKAANSATNTPARPKKQQRADGGSTPSFLAPPDQVHKK